MKLFSPIVLILVAGVSLAASAARGVEIGTAFTYQGRLEFNGSPVSDTCAFEFSLWDAESGGNLVVGSGDPVNAVVADGLFAVKMDFGIGAFSGEARWLEMMVKCSSDSDFITLQPRQELTPAPYALALPGLSTQPNATCPNLIGGHSGNEVADGVVGSTIGGGGAEGEDLGINSVTADYATIGGGHSNRVIKQDGTVGGGKRNVAGNNHADPINGSAATVGGGVHNEATGGGATVGGGSQNIASDWYATVGGGFTNEAQAAFATVAGGGALQWGSPTCEGGDNHGALCGGCSSDPTNLACENPDGCPDPQSETCDPTDSYCTGGGVCRTGGVGNQVYDEYATIGGGASNRAGSDDGDTENNRFATVGGGQENNVYANAGTIAGGSLNRVTDWFGTVGGGINNQAGDNAGTVLDAQYATVAGGNDNYATAWAASVGGGYSNFSEGAFATIPGGWLNSANARAATVGGGVTNVARADYATVSGGGPAHGEGPACEGGDNHGGQCGVCSDNPTIFCDDASSCPDPQNETCDPTDSYCTGGGVCRGDGVGNAVYDNFGTIGGGGSNRAGDNDGDPWSTPFATVAGGERNIASRAYSAVGGGRNNAALAAYATIGGGGGSPVPSACEGGDNHGAPCGGCSSDPTNLPCNGPQDCTPPDTCDPTDSPYCDDGGVCRAGGVGNQVYDNYGTIGGGAWNRVGTNDDDDENAEFATVGGGVNNVASGNRDTVGGGWNNTANGGSATIGGGWGNRVTDALCTIGGGVNNQAGDDAGTLGDAMHATVGGGNDNHALAWAATVGGGESNGVWAQHGTIAGGQLNVTNGSYATVGGGLSNAAQAAYATVAGGGGIQSDGPTCEGGGNHGAPCGGCSSDPTNLPCGGPEHCPDPENETCDPTASYCTGGGVCRAGGVGNRAYDEFGAIGGGGSNRAGSNDGDPLNGSFATVGGGSQNTASAPGATVSGGTTNAAAGENATVAGGSSNTASSWGATVPGGWLNIAAGMNSFAAGQGAWANHAGSFVWADTSADVSDYFESTGDNQFLISAAGGVGIGTNDPQYLLHVNGDAGKPGGGSWSNASDRRLKKNVRDLKDALPRLLQLRGVTYEYKDPAAIHERPGVQIGMIAQEVEEAFPDWIDDAPDGYKRLTFRGFEALAVEAMRALHEQNEEKDARIADLEARLAALEARLGEPAQAKRGGAR